MPRRPLGERAMTDAERQARHHARKQEKAARWRDALERILEARAIVQEALEEKPPED